MHLPSDSSRLAIGSEVAGAGRAYIYDTADGTQPLHQFEHPKAVWCVRLSPPATMMATMSRWWGSSSDLPSVPSLESVIDFGAPVAERAVACKGPDATMSQLRREPRASVLERPERRDQGPSDGDQLDSLLSELLTLRSAQARLLAQPSVLKGACSLLPPCSTSSSSRLSSPAPLRRGSFAEAVRQ